MKLYHLILFITLCLLLWGITAAAIPDTLPAAGRGFSLPPQAVEKAPGMYYLGTGFDHGRLVEGYAFVHYQPGYARPLQPGKPPADSSCYTYLAKGAKWKTVEPYLVDLTNSQGLSTKTLAKNLADDIAKWEEAAGVNILGDQASGKVDGADTQNPDNKNEVLFAAISDPNTIAVTIVWGYFSGPAFSRELIEWDQVYSTGYAWSLSGEAGKMDFENIATHELGHSVGMGDLYSSACSQQTMYGYADFGETLKRDLAGGDIAGIRALYE